MLQIFWGVQFASNGRTDQRREVASGESNSKECVNFGAE